MNEIKISVIIPVYNAEKFLRQCLDSVLNQTLQNIEVICVNDGSSDKSGSILEEYGKKDNRIKVIDQGNQGLSGARNAGMKIANGEYLTFVDSDDWIDLDMLELLYTTANKENYDIVMCTYVKEFGDHQSNVSIYDTEGEKDINYVLRRLVGPIDDEVCRPQELDLPVSACMQLIKREKTGGVQFVDTRQIGTEDLLFQLQTYTKCDSFFYVDKCLYHYRRSDYGTLTTKYMPDKFDRWQNLYLRINQMINDSKWPSQFTLALNNRKAISILGIGLNETFSSYGYIKKALHLKSILSNSEYSEAFNNLDLQYFPFHWRLFFKLCKHKCSFSLMLMLELIEFLRKRKV